MNLAVSALRFFFKVTLCRPEFGEWLARVRKEQRLPVVLSPEEVALLLHCAPSLKHKAALSVAYGCGLRVSEIVHLTSGILPIRLVLVAAAVLMLTGSYSSVVSVNIATRVGASVSTWRSNALYPGPGR